MSQLRIFSYLPNPRSGKRRLAARLCGVDHRGPRASPKELENWLWDFDAHPLRGDEPTTRRTFASGRSASRAPPAEDRRISRGTSVRHRTRRVQPRRKTASSNRTASCGRSHGSRGETAALRPRRVRGLARRSFLDTSLVFARDSQIYLLSLMMGNLTSEIHARASRRFCDVGGRIDQALSGQRTWLVGDGVTLADVCSRPSSRSSSREDARRGDRGARPRADPRREARRRVSARARTLRETAEASAFAPEMEPYLAKLGV